jgi:hypothetical protein
MNSSTEIPNPQPSATSAPAASGLTPSSAPAHAITSSEINYSDLSDVVANRNNLNDSQQFLFRQVYYHVKRKNSLFKTEYYDNALLVVGAEPVFAKKLCCCGMSNPKNKGGYCNKRHFCPRCSQYKGYWHLEKYKNCLHKGNLYFVTFSYEGGLKTADQSSIAQAHLNLDAIQNAIHQAYRNKSIKGGLVSEEIAVLQLCPNIVQPHAHAIIDADDINEGLVAEFENSIISFTNSDGDRVTAKPSIRLNKIKNQNEYESQLRYLFKPIDLKTSYTLAWDQKYTEDRKLMWQVNSALKNLFGWHTEFTKYKCDGGKLAVGARMMVKCFGTMHAADKRYIGAKQKKAKRKTKFKSRIIPAKPYTVDAELCERAAKLAEVVLDNPALA